MDMTKEDDIGGGTVVTTIFNHEMFEPMFQFVVLSHNNQAQVPSSVASYAGDDIPDSLWQRIFQLHKGGLLKKSNDSELN